MPMIGGFLLLLGAAAAAAASESTQDVLTTDLINWLRAEGSFINDKIQIRHINPNDPTSPRGLFAVESLEEGETVCNIPWDLVLKPPTPEENTKSLKEKSAELYCGTINAVIEEIGKNKSEMTPYGKYLLSQPRGYTVGFWSDEGKELFWEMTDDEKLPPIWIEESMEEWEELCDGDGENNDHVFALMLVKARADYLYLVPFYGELQWLHTHRFIFWLHMTNPLLPTLLIRHVEP